MGNLGNYACFLRSSKKNLLQAEQFYLQALEIDPEHANNLCKLQYELTF